MSRPQAGSRKRALARIQRLCCLGVSSEAIMPDLLRDVTELCRSHDAVFCWTDPKGDTTNFYATFATASELEFYFREFHSRERGRELFKHRNLAREWPRSTPVLPFDKCLAVERGEWLRSDYYNLLWRPHGFYQGLGLGVRQNGRVRGMLFVFRGVNQPPFERSDGDALAGVAGFIAHSLSPTAAEQAASAEGEEPALIVVDRGGHIRHGNLRARKLLSMALQPRLSLSFDWHVLREPWPALAKLCDGLAATAEGRIEQPPPVLRLRNAWGEFVLRAYWLGLTDGVEAGRHIGLIIERRVPMLLAVHRRLESLPLTAREKQAGLLLTRDLPLRQVAEAMGVAANTAITHQGSLYAKLGVRSRVGLLQALLPS